MSSNYTFITGYVPLRQQKFDDQNYLTQD
uniref:Uncharacterized protein n=1 Tax=Arundo donax TaxID=35708 RepID=A0A0A9A4X9_ARUDO